MLGNHMFWPLMLFYTHFAAVAVTFRAMAFYSYPQGRGTPLFTSCISKVAEEFVVDGFVKPAVMNILNDNQYRAIPNSSTTMVLISMLHSWS